MDRDANQGLDLTRGERKPAVLANGGKRCLEWVLDSVTSTRSLPSRVSPSARCASLPGKQPNATPPHDLAPNALDATNGPTVRSDTRLLRHPQWTSRALLSLASKTIRHRLGRCANTICCRSMGSRGRCRQGQVPFNGQGSGARLYEAGGRQLSDRGHIIDCGFKASSSLLLIPEYGESIHIDPRSAGGSGPRQAWRTRQIDTWGAGTTRLDNSRRPYGKQSEDNTCLRRVLFEHGCNGAADVKGIPIAAHACPDSHRSQALE